MKYRKKPEDSERCSMTRDELKQAIFDRLLSTANDDNRPFDAPVIDLDSIMALIDAYAVGIVSESYTGPRTGSFQPPSEAAARAWLKDRR